jgi:hypothetical protein
MEAGRRFRVFVGVRRIGLGSTGFEHGHRVTVAGGIGKGVLGGGADGSGRV